MSTPRKSIRKVAVLGAGVMGSRIAAHIANAGLPVVLLDLPAQGPNRNATVAAAVEALRKAKPAAFFTPEAASLITIGNFDDDLPLLNSCDWIIEVVAENLAIKRDLLTRVLDHRTPGTITSTNTSGLPIASIVAGLDHPHAADLRQHWFGTHFFNPPRYMALLEIIPTPDSLPADLETISAFCDRNLGKTVVRSRDTPNFIANRIGTFAVLNAFRLMREQGLSIEEVDALTGSAIGWPRTGTFRLLDLVGIDVFAHVARNFSAQAAAIHDERPEVVLPEVVDRMIEKRWLGDKTAQGFYKKAGKDPSGRDLRMVLDLETLDYRPSVPGKLPALESAKPLPTAAARIAQLLAGNPAKDKAAAFLWPLLTELFTYAANRVSAASTEPAETIVAVDEALKAGFNWELGPFEMMDAAGLRATVDHLRAESRPTSPNVEALLAAEPGADAAWYKEDPAAPAGRQFFSPADGKFYPVPLPEGVLSLTACRNSHGVVRKNAGASLIDLGDGVAAIELHSKMNAIGVDIITFLQQTLAPTSPAQSQFEAFVITGEGANFSVGANLMQILLSIQEAEWDDIDRSVRQFQNMTQAIKFSPRPVVVTPFSMCLGGGVEIALHGAARQAHAETYMGLVEAGVGLIPGGGGCKEMLLRANPSNFAATFERIAKATVSTSAAEAREMGFLSSGDGISMNRRRLLADAKAVARTLADTNHLPPTPRADIPAPGQNALAQLKLGVWTMREGGYISVHDAKVADAAAHVLCGGAVTAGTLVSEQYLLDLEREAFLKLCGEKKTAERIAFTLKTGKPLRN